MPNSGVKSVVEHMECVREKDIHCADNTVIFAFLASFKIGYFLAAINRATAHLSHAASVRCGSHVYAGRTNRGGNGEGRRFR